MSYEPSRSMLGAKGGEMTAHAVGRSTIEARAWHGLSVHWAWLGGGFVLGFAVPFVFADVLQINRDVLLRDLRTLRGRPVRAVVAIDWLRPRAGGDAALGRCASAGARCRRRACGSRHTDGGCDRSTGGRSISSVRSHGGRRLRHHGRDAPVGVPDPRGVRGVRGFSPEPTSCGQGRDRHRCSSRIARNDVRLPRRL